ncbi:hypothetical protein ES703_32511 [subsurface metagenome]
MSDWFAPSLPIYGDDCLTCFPAGQTPKHFYVMAGSITYGDDWFPFMGPPFNGLWFMTQDLVDPCKWQGPAGPHGFARLRFLVGRTILTIVNDAPLTSYLSDVLVGCVRYSVNDFNIAAGNRFYGGYAYIFTPTEIQELIENFTPVVDPDPLLRVDPLANEELIISYIDEWGDTKIKFKLDIS